MDGAIQARLEAGERTPWVPNQGPQALAYLSPADELFYGGSAGGGKSWLLLGLALTAQTRSLILRMNATNLQQLKDDLLSMIGPLDRWKSIGYGGVLETSDDRKVEMHGCESPTEARKYMGRAHDGKFWDELPTFGEETFRFVNAWNRTTEKGQRCRIVGAGNPPTRPEEEWVIRYWAPWLDAQHPRPAVPGELRWFCVLDGKDVEVENGHPFQHGKELIYPRSRTFIPARLEDNPDLERQGYRAVLQGLPEPLRSQLLYGTMDAGRADDEWQLIPTSWAREAMKRWRADGRGDLKLSCAALDCAMGGQDRACLAKRYGMWIAPLLTWPGATIKNGEDFIPKVLPQLETLQMPLLVDIGATAGGSAVTAFRLSVPTLPVRAVNFGEGSSYKDKTGRLEMRNLRAEMYWRLKDALDPASKRNLALPDDPELLSEICAARWHVSGGRVVLEDKDDIRKRLGRSPDKADAIAMTMLTDNPLHGGWLPRVEPSPSAPRAPSERWVPRAGRSGGFMGDG